MAVAAVILAFSFLRADELWNGEIPDAAVGLYSFGPDGARAILSALSSSMITVAALTFSLTMLTLQLASQQFGPRLLRNFMRDRVNQFVLGVFIGTFVYCLLILRTIRGTEENAFVPHLSVAFGLLLAITSLVVLIFFIHHVATSIRLETVLTDLTAETKKIIDDVYCPRFFDEPADQPPQTAFPRHLIAAPETGYIQHVDVAALVRIAHNLNLVLTMETPVGSFVLTGDPVLAATSHSGLEQDCRDHIASAVLIGSERTPEQDPRFSVGRIVEIAQRALSSGINDPKTAMYCIDRLKELIVQIASLRSGTRFHCDKDERVRFYFAVPSAADIVKHVCISIGRYARDDAEVMEHLHALVNHVAAHADEAEQSDLAKTAQQLRSLLRDPSAAIPGAS